MKQKGILLILLSGIGYGFLGIFGKYLYANGVAGGPALAVRFILASLMLWPYVLFFKRDELKNLQTKDVLTLILLGVFGYAAFSSLYFLALEGLSASMTVLLLYTYPGMVTLLSFFFLKEKLKKNQAIALALSFPGIVLLIGGNYVLSSKLSVLYGLLCALTYAIYIVVSGISLKKIDALISVAIIQTSAAIVLSMIHLQSWEVLQFTLHKGLWPILGLSIVVTILPMVTFALGIKHLTSNEVSLLYTIEPVAAIGLATVLFGERMDIKQMVGGLLVITALVLMSKKAKPD